jgi:hypothetical protein
LIKEEGRKIVQGVNQFLRALSLGLLVYREKDDREKKIFTGDIVSYKGTAIVSVILF